MLERERCFDLVHMRECVWEWVHVAKIVIHHSLLGLEELAPSNGFPAKMSEYTMISNQIRFEFFYFEKKSDSLSVVADGNEHTDVFHNFSSSPSRDVFAKHLYLIAHGLEHYFYIMDVGFDASDLIDEVRNKQNFFHLRTSQFGKFFLSRFERII